MSIERFDVDHQRYLGHPDPNGDLCYYKDVAKLEAQHAELLDVLKTLTGCWDNDINEVLFWHNKPRAYIIGRAIEQLREAIVKAEREQMP